MLIVLEREFVLPNCESTAPDLSAASVTDTSEASLRAAVSKRSLRGAHSERQRAVKILVSTRRSAAELVSRSPEPAEGHLQSERAGEFASCFENSDHAGNALSADLMQWPAAISIATPYFGQRLSATLFDLFAMKIAGVFMVLTCTIGLRTSIIARWVALISHVAAVVLLLVIANWKWITLVFPAWMLLLSVHMLLKEFHARYVRTADMMGFGCAD
jgi:hypothetical protein